MEPNEHPTFSYRSYAKHRKIRKGLDSTMTDVESSLAHTNSEKLYLDSRTADVKFIFGSGIKHFEIIPAHKSILSVGSPVFDVMFYGSLPEKGDIPIDDTSPAAFKEFLQFFYLQNVRLTSENIIEVTKLCKKYVMVDELRLCERPLQKSLTIDEMCSGYAFATLLELNNTKYFCEEKIRKNAHQILKSASFLECSGEIFDKILQLVSPDGSSSIVGAVVIVDSSIAWAKAQCVRKNIGETPAALRAELQRSYNRIPFAEMDTKQFELFVATYNGFLRESDLVAIVLKVMNLAAVLKRENKLQSERRCDYDCYDCKDRDSYIDYDVDDL